MQGLEISGSWFWGASACTCCLYEKPTRSGLTVNHCALPAHAQQSLPEIQMLFLLRTCLGQNVLPLRAKGTQKASPSPSRGLRASELLPPCHLCLCSALCSTGGEKRWNKMAQNWVAGQQLGTDQLGWGRGNKARDGADGSKTGWEQGRMTGFQGDRRMQRKDKFRDEAEGDSLLHTEQKVF